MSRFASSGYDARRKRSPALTVARVRELALRISKRAAAFDNRRDHRRAIDRQRSACEAARLSSPLRRAPSILRAWAHARRSTCPSASRRRRRRPPAAARFLPLEPARFEQLSPLFGAAGALFVGEVRRRRRGSSRCEAGTRTRRRPGTCSCRTSRREANTADTCPSCLPRAHRTHPAIAGSSAGRGAWVSAVPFRHKPRGARSSRPPACTFPSTSARPTAHRRCCRSRNPSRPPEIHPPAARPHRAGRESCCCIRRDSGGAPLHALPSLGRRRRLR